MNRPLPNLQIDPAEIARAMPTVVAMVCPPLIFVSLFSLVGGVGLLAVMVLVVGITLQLVPLLGLSLALAAVVMSSVLLWRALQTLKAGHAPELESEVISLLNLTDLLAQAREDVSTVLSRRGGLAAIGRVRALRRLFGIASGEFVEDYPHARWFFGPAFMTTGNLMAPTAWLGVAGWLVSVALLVRAWGLV